MHRFVGTYRHHDRSGAAVVVFEVQTDFAARTQVVQEFADRCAMVAYGASASFVDELVVCDYPPSLGDVPVTVARAESEMSTWIGEEITIVSVEVVRAR